MNHQPWEKTDLASGASQSEAVQCCASVCSHLQLFITLHIIHTNYHRYILGIHIWELYDMKSIICNTHYVVYHVYKERESWIMY